MSPIFELPPTAKPSDSVPKVFGIVVYPGFQALDVFGPLDALNMLSLAYPLKLYVIAETLDPVSTKIPSHHLPDGSDFSQCIVPTHKFDDVPSIDVLLVPGGFGNRPPANLDAALAYITKVYPDLRYLVTVCTGSALVARTSLLDGRQATTNKRAFKATAALRPQVKWVAQARWVVDGNIWTSSGVSAGIDVTLAFIGDVYGRDVADMISDFLEYERHTDSAWDPYAEKMGLV